MAADVCFSQTGVGYTFFIYASPGLAPGHPFFAISSPILRTHVPRTRHREGGIRAGHNSKN